MEGEKKTSEKVLEIRKKIINFKKYIIEYGFNPEQDIFIKRELEDIEKYLTENEKRFNK
tara:strand:- start:2868 stop:3044 length:177 start_codon:yes stop_codon:yes gene_type:complete